MMQLLMVMAYDSASNNAIRIELEQREQDLKQKKRAEEERAIRLSFLAQAAAACKKIPVIAKYRVICQQFVFK